MAFPTDPLNHCLDCATLYPVTRTPFDVLAEELDLSKNRGGSTPIELFLEGVRVWESGARRLLSIKAAYEGASGVDWP